MSSVPHPPDFSRRDWLRLWQRTALAGTALLVALFAGYEIAERVLLRERVPAERLFTYHLVRGVGASVLLGTVAVLMIWRSRHAYDEAFAAAYRRAEEMVKDRSRELLRLEATVRYQEKLAALGVLAAGIAHDIGNPLASMSSELEMIEMETDLGRVRDSIGVLRGQVARIDRILREMTDFARRRGDEVTEVAVHVAVADALRMVRHDPRARAIAIEADVPEDLPRLRFVEDHLVMVLVNLLINAFDAMPGGGSIAIQARKQGGHVSIVVRDTGSGMNEDVRMRAHEPFFTTKHEARGTGLGLAVSADVIRAAGGSLEIVSAPARGTTVTLTLPREAHHV
jgi:signal transduction histidine kinase